MYKKVIKLMSLALLIGLLFVTVSCGGTDTSTQQDQEPQQTTQTELMVFTAASLTDLVQEYAKNFEANNPGVTVKVNAAGTQQLRTQLEQGATADIFLSANPDHIMALREKNLTEEPVTLAHNAIVLIVSDQSDFQPASLADLTAPHRMVLANEEVPVGKYSLQVLKNLNALFGPEYSEKVLQNVVSKETNVRQVLTKVSLGEADCGMVYATDAKIGENIKVVGIPEEYNVVTDYLGAVVTESPQPELAQSFLDGLKNDKVLWEKYGFNV
jgi:molybdate transport system substrate-binding protein